MVLQDHGLICTVCVHVKERIKSVFPYSSCMIRLYSRAFACRVSHACWVAVPRVPCHSLWLRAASQEELAARAKEKRKRKRQAAMREAEYKRQMEAMIAKAEATCKAGGPNDDAEVGMIGRASQTVSQATQRLGDSLKPSSLGESLKPFFAALL